MNPLLMIVVAVLIAITMGGSFFATIALWYLVVLIYDEIVLMRKPTQTRTERIQEEIDWERFLIDLKDYHDTRPLNVFRDGSYV